MPNYGPLSRKKLIQGLRDAGFEGPFNSKRGDHPEFMKKEGLLVKLPNTHGSDDIGLPLLKRILNQAGIDRTTWESL